MRTLVLPIVIATTILAHGGQPARPDTAARSAAPVFNRQPLRTEALVPLPLGAVLPRGWLRRQLRIQAEGLTGHLDEIWPDVGKNSGWLGGTGESWERGPYFVDGLVPLAYLLQDERLIAKARPWVEWTLTHQEQDGRIGPPKNTDWWPNMVMLKALTQYQEATGDPRVIPLMQRYFAYHLANGRSGPLQRVGRVSMGRRARRACSGCTTGPATASLLELARLLHDQGTDWKRHFADFEFTREDDERSSSASRPAAGCRIARCCAHGVNNAMALKTSALWSLVSGDPTDRDAIHRALDVLDRYHGLPNGMFSADEHYAGSRSLRRRSSSARWSRRCSRCSTSIRVTGDARRLPIASSGSPSTRCRRRSRPTCGPTSTDQQPNQVLCTLAKRALGQQRARSRTCSASNRTSAAAPPTCTRGGRSWYRASGC